METYVRCCFSHGYRRGPQDVQDVARCAGFRGDFGSLVNACGANAHGSEVPVGRCPTLRAAALSGPRRCETVTWTYYDADFCHKALASLDRKRVRSPLSSFFTRFTGESTKPDHCGAWAAREPVFCSFSAACRAEPVVAFGKTAGDFLAASEQGELQGYPP